MKSFLKHKKKISKKNVEESPARITNETVAEHREKVLAGGRKFKYPVQYQKHKLVVNSIIIAVVAIVLLTILGWYQLYVAQNNSQLMYRIAQIIPVSVASVDGEPVRYSDYLMRSHSVIFYMQKMDLINLGSDNGKCQEAYYKRQELTNTEKNTYVNKLARELKLNVSDKEVDDFIKKDIDARAVSLNAYEKTVLNSYYDWSLDEYKSVVKNELLKRKVSFSVDNDAKARATSILNEVKAGGDFATIATLHSDDDNTKANGGTVLALIYFFRKRIAKIIHEIFYEKDYRLARNVVIAIIPAGLLGFMLSSTIESNPFFSSAWTVVVTLLVVGVLLILLEKLPMLSKVKDSAELSWKRSLSIGLAQATALIPGVSRSGATIIASRVAGLNREKAAEFSFLISIPVMLGVILKLIIKESNRAYLFDNWQTLLVANFVAFLTGLFAITFLMSYIERKPLTVFGWYRIGLATVVAAILLIQ